MLFSCDRGSVSTGLHLTTCVALAVAGSSAMAVQFDNESGDNTWANPLNWDGDVLPDTSDGTPGAAEIFAPINVNLSTSQTIRELQLGDSVLGAPGVSTLTVLPGGTLHMGNANNRIGREVTAGNYGEATGHLIVDGGTVISDRSIRLSYDKPESADSILEVRSGILRNLTDRIHVGRDIRAFNKAEFRVVGSQATEISTEDLFFLQGFNGGTSLASFQIDAGGITTIVATDELQLIGATLNVSMLDDYDPANGDIRLINAARLTQDEAFSNFLQGSTVSASTAAFQYDWTIDYIDDDPIGGGVFLRDLVRTAIGGGIDGDYNDSGLVEQGDLDQVLSNWGAGFAGIPATWINQRPTEGIVDQAELDVVLTQWGSSSAPDFSGSTVPEPASLVMLGSAGLLMSVRRRAGR